MQVALTSSSFILAHLESEPSPGLVYLQSKFLSCVWRFRAEMWSKLILVLPLFLSPFDPKGNSTAFCFLLTHQIHDRRLRQKFQHAPDAC